MAGGGEDAFGQGVHLDGEARGHGGEDSGVDAYAGLLHAQKDGDEREIHGAVEMKERVRGGWRSRSLPLRQAQGMG